MKEFVCEVKVVSRFRDAQPRSGEMFIEPRP
jgi:hypothetical protein